MSKREKECDPARTLRRMRNFVVAVLLAVLAWLLLSRAYVATRADNALDELYYSTLDHGSGTALLCGHYSPTVLASALSAYKDDRPRNAGIYKRERFDDSPPYANKVIYLYSYQDGKVVAVKGVELLLWYVDDGSSEGEPGPTTGRSIVFRVHLSPGNLGGSPSGCDCFSDTYKTTWVYDVDSKILSLFSVDGPLGDDLNGRDAYSGTIVRQGDYAEKIFALNGADPMLAAERCGEVIRDVVLRGYLEGTGLSGDEVESELSEVDPIIDEGVDRAKDIYRSYWAERSGE